MYLTASNGNGKLLSFFVFTNTVNHVHEQFPVTYLTNKNDTEDMNIILSDTSRQLLR